MDSSSLAQLFCKNLWTLLLDSQRSYTNKTSQSMKGGARATDGSPATYGSIAAEQPTKVAKLMEVRDREIREAEEAEADKKLKNGTYSSEIKESQHGKPSSHSTKSEILVKEHHKEDSRKNIFSRDRESYSHSTSRRRDTERKYDSSPRRDYSLARRRSPVLHHERSPSPLAHYRHSPSYSHSRRSPSPVTGSKDRPAIPSRHADHQSGSGRFNPLVYNSYRPSPRRRSSDRRRQSPPLVPSRDRDWERSPRRSYEQMRSLERERRRTRRDRSLEKQPERVDGRRRNVDTDRHWSRGDRERREREVTDIERHRREYHRDVQRLARTPPPIPEKNVARSPERRPAKYAFLQNLTESLIEINF